MTQLTIADVIRQMLLDWNAATPEQRQSALDTVANLADAVERGAAARRRYDAR